MITKEQRAELRTVAEKYYPMGLTMLSVLDSLDAMEAERDSWKHQANEYSAYLQPLVMNVPYPQCEPVSHKWPGKRHVDGVSEGVEFLIARIAKLEAERDAAIQARDVLRKEVNAGRSYTDSIQDEDYDPDASRAYHEARVSTDAAKALGDNT